MSTTYDITGVGPVQPNGTTIIFTTNSQPYYATAAQITAFTRNPVLGDQVQDLGNGSFNLIANPGSVAAEAPNIDPVDDGGDDTDGGSETI